MRYQSWDVLVFPDISKVPQQEFKTICQVVHDPDALGLLPVVTSFISSLPADSPFQISIHSWQDPQFSPAIENNIRHSSAAFEARLFLDGKMVVSKIFEQDGPWPSILSYCSNDEKVEKIKFPPFHKAVLRQSYWSPGDDLGRVKLVIAEGYVHEDHTFERTKNIVAFAFQHAPLDVLEASAIAWPSAAMWKDAPPTPTFDPYTAPVIAAFNGLREIPGNVANTCQSAALRHISADSSNISMPDYESRKASAQSSVL